MTPEQIEKQRERSRRSYLKNREKVLARGRAWRQANPDKVRAYSAAHRAEHPEREREYQLRWKAKNPEYEREWRARNPEKMAAARARFFKAHPKAWREWKRASPEKRREYDKRWRVSNPQKHRDKGHRYQARKRGAPVVEKFARVAIYERDGGRCHLCGRFVAKSKFTLDHLVPLALGGEHTAANVKVAHLSCNSRKGARFIST